MNFSKALATAKEGGVIFRPCRDFKYDFLVFVAGRTMKPSFDPMLKALGAEMDMSILDHLDGVKFTSRTSCTCQVGAALSQEDLMADDWMIANGQDVLDSVFPDPASMTN